ncbi:hypothetical protein JCM6882_001505 [Rhodosporidiobolus microsporus]
MAPSRGRSHHRHLLHPPFPPLLPLLLLSLLLLALPSTHAAPSTADLLTYLGGSATGQSFTIPAGYTLTVAANEEKVLISASFDGKKASEVGWVGFGVGSAMTDADIVVCWPTVDGETLTWTLSHRTATSTVMPTLVGSANADDPSSDSTGALKIVAELSSAGGDETPAVVTWERALAMEEGYEGGENYQLEARINQQFIYAYGEDNPGDAAQDTDFKQHSLDAMGGAYVDLSASFTADTAAIDPPLTPLDESESGGGGDDEEAMTTADGTGGAGGSSKTETGSGGGATGTGTATATSGGEETGAGGGGSTATGTGTKTAGGSTATGGSSSTGGTGGTSGAGGTFSYSTVILIHGVCAGACWGFLAPMGVLFARYGRGPPGTTLTKFPWHFTMQGWVVTPLTFIAGGLALWAVSLKSSTSSEPFAHKTLGFIFLGGLALQDLLGLLKHFVKTPGASPQRGLLGWCHIMLGVTLIAVGFVQVKLGIERYGADDVVLYGLYGRSSQLRPHLLLRLPRAALARLTATVLTTRTLPRIVDITVLRLAGLTSG